MIISLLGVCVLRVGWILIAVPLKRDITRSCSAIPDLGYYNNAVCYLLSVLEN